MNPNFTEKEPEMSCKYFPWAGRWVNQYKGYDRQKLLAKASLHRRRRLLYVTGTVSWACVHAISMTVALIFKYAYIGSR